MLRNAVSYGKKTPEYHDLFEAVRTAAWDEMRRIGWVTAEDRVEVHLRRYCVDYRSRDASNLGKCEFDAMARWKHGQPIEGFPGIYVNDAQVRPFPDVVVDPREGARDRIAIAVFRVALFGEVAKRRRVAKPSMTVVPAGAPTSAEAILSTVRGGYAVLAGEKIPIAKALALIENEGSDRGRRRR